MKTIIFSILSITFSFLAEAQPYFIERCEEELARQGSGLEHSAPSQQCRQVLADQVEPMNRFRYGLDQELIKSLGLAISLTQIVDDQKQSFYISGNETQLEDAIAVRSNGKDLTDLMVINQSGTTRSILHFNARYPGNIAPQSIYENSSFTDAIDVDFNLDQGLVLVLHQDSQRITVWDSRYHSRRHQPQKKAARLLQSMDLPKAHPISFTLVDQDYLAVLFNDGEIILFDKASLTPLQTIESSIDNDQGLTLDWDQSNQRLIILKRKTIIDEFNFQ